jgi:hypothetical protein
MMGGRVPNATFCVPAYRAALKLVFFFSDILGKIKSDKNIYDICSPCNGDEETDKLN